MAALVKKKMELSLAFLRQQDIPHPPGYVFRPDTGLQNK